jgi:hypothetical protein
MYNNGGKFQKLVWLGVFIAIFLRLPLSKNLSVRLCQSLQTNRLSQIFIRFVSRPNITDNEIPNSTVIEI